MEEKVTLQGLSKPFSEGTPLVVDTNSHATVQTLISEFCAKKGVGYDSNLLIFDEEHKLLPILDTIRSAGIVNGQKLFIGYRDEGQKSWFTRWPLFVAVGALVVGVSMIVTLSLLYSLSGGFVPFDLGVVMDAGSTKTQAILYEWKGNKYKGTGCVKQVKDCTVKGGIAKTDDIDTYITKIVACTKSLTSVVKNEILSTTPLYFTATAGMRLLEISDESKSDSIILRLQQRLNETGLSVRNVSIIPGSSEGMYGWITTNFLKDTLEKEIPSEGAPLTYGALDLGGASTQVTFTVPSTDDNANKSVKLTLFDQDHFVYAKSYLCFGRDEAQRRYLALLAGRVLLQDRYATIFEDPCAPKESTLYKNGSFLFFEPCTNSSLFKILMSNDIAETNYSFVGSSDYEKCRSVVVELLDYQACKDRFGECFEKLPREIVYQKFVAFAAYYYTTSFLNVTQSNLTEYENAMVENCGKSINEIHGDKEHKAEYCFNSVYIHEILVNKYGFNATSWKNLEFEMKIDEKNLGWTLGYMINATNAIPAKAPSKKIIPPNVLIVCLLVFIIVVIATAVYITSSTRNKTRGSHSFEPKL